MPANEFSAGATLNRPLRHRYGNTAGFGSKAQYDVARDGRFLLSVSADDAIASPIKIVLNWDSQLKK